MDATLVKDIGIKALLVGGAGLVSFWIFNTRCKVIYVVGSLKVSFGGCESIFNYV